MATGGRSKNNFLQQKEAKRPYSASSPTLSSLWSPSCLNSLHNRESYSVVRQLEKTALGAKLLIRETDRGWSTAIRWQPLFDTTLRFVLLQSRASTSEQRGNQKDCDPGDSRRLAFQKEKAKAKTTSAKPGARQCTIPGILRRRGHCTKFWDDLCTRQSME